MSSGAPAIAAETPNPETAGGMAVARQHMLGNGGNRRLPAPYRLPVLLVVLALPFAACAELSPSAGSPVKVEAESRLSIVLGPVGSVDDATARRMAGEHCAKHGERAQLVRMVGPSSVHYQCMQ